MKDIYELLNDADIDFSNTQQVEVSELERKRGKKKLMTSIKKSKARKRKITVAAASLLIIGSTSIMAMSNPAFAQNIPFIGNLVQNNLINTNSNYKDYMNVIGQTKSVDGIDVTFENAIADNNMLFLSFVVKNNNAPLNGNLTDALLIPSKLKVNDKEINTSGSAAHEIIDKNTVRILTQIPWNYTTLPYKFNIDIAISQMFGKTGDWGVKFSMDTKEITKNTSVNNINKTFNIHGIDFSVNQLTISPLTTNIKYYAKTEDENIYMDFLALDQDGNEVKFSNGRSTTKDCEDFIKGRIDFSSNYISTKNIKSLTLIPVYRNMVSSTADKEMTKNTNNKKILASKKVNLDEFKPFDLKLTEKLSLAINSCTIDGDKLIVKHNYKYDGKNINALDTCLSVKSNNVELEEINDFNTGEKYKDSNSRVSIYKIGTNKEIEIGCYDTAANSLLEKEAFKVVKK